MPAEYGGLTIELLHHASIKITTTNGTVVYVDPWSEGLPEDPDPADVVFVSHDDTDHYDPDAIEAVATDETTIVAYEEIDTSALQYEVTPVGVDERKTIAGIDVRTVPAYNRADGEHVDEDGNPWHAEGEAIGFVLGFEEGTVFYPSDTDFLDEHEQIRADVFVPPIGGHYTMDRHEAAQLARSVDPELVVPVHYDTFETIETDADAFKEELEADGIAVVLL